MSNILFFWPSFFIFLTALFVESYFSWKFLRGLRKNFPQMWCRLGKRTIWTDADLFSAWRTIRLLSGRKYLGLGSKAAEEFCEAYRIPVIASYYAALLGAFTFLTTVVVGSLLKN
ncbi:MAG: hypothetical protein JKX88_03745 [Marinicaulis sp.]|nr:hypothetical protein [Marinicaulis sp.]